ncbi:hypothetical protein ACIQT7_00005, partial [Agrobacterium deltaense]
MEGSLRRPFSVFAYFFDDWGNLRLGCRCGKLGARHYSRHASSVMPGLTRHPAGARLRDERTPFSPKTWAGWIPAQATVDDQANAGSVLAMALRIVTSFRIVATMA